MVEDDEHERVKDLDSLNCSTNNYSTCQVVTGDMRKPGKKGEGSYFLIFKKDSRVPSGDVSPLSHILHYLGQPDIVSEGDLAFPVDENTIERLYSEMVSTRRRQELADKENHQRRNPSHRSGL